MQIIFKIKKDDAVKKTHEDKESSNSDHTRVVDAILRLNAPRLPLY